MDAMSWGREIYTPILSLNNDFSLSDISVAVVVAVVTAAAVVVIVVICH